MGYMSTPLNSRGRKLPLTEPEMDLFQFVGSQIRTFRRSRDGAELLQSDLANALGVPQNTISRWESGTYRPQLDDLVRLSAFFGVPVASFFPPAVSDRMTYFAALVEVGRYLDVADLRAVLRL